MSSLLRLLTMTAALLVAVVQQTAGAPILFGTVGAGNVPSTLVVINPANGALLSTVGAVGFTVNGLAWDPRSQQLYATTSVRDLHFHGLITINPLTGVGTPVDSSVINFGLGAGSSPIHSITIDVLGQMVGWYDEVPPATSDTFVRINKHTGVATEFPNTGIDTAQNGLSFSDLNFLWNIDSPLQHPDGTFTQTA